MTRKLVAVVFAFSFCIGLCQRCEVRVAYPKVVGFTGYTSILNCSYTDCLNPLYVMWYNGTLSDGVSILWKINNNPVRVGRFSIVGQADLQIDDVTKEDENIYTCRVLNIHPYISVNKTTMFNVEETIPPDIIDISFDELPIVEGQDVSMTCSATGTRLGFEWRYGGRLLYETERYRLDEDGSRLFIRDVQRSDAGNVTCIASNIIGTATMAVFIDVYYEPDLPNCSYSNPNIPYEGDSITVVCGSADGNPLATLQWFNTARDILRETTPPYTGDTAINEYSWTVSRTDNQETFHCEATNQVQAQPLHCSTGNLRVFFATRNVTLTGNNGPMINGDRLVLTCETSSSNPASEITWFRNNTKIGSSDQERTGDDMIKDSSFHGFAALQNLTVDITPEFNHIRYHCGASLGSDEISANSTIEVINVFFPPEQPEPCNTRITGYSDYYLEGDDLELSCISCSANPAADIEWFRNGVDLTRGIGKTETTAGHFDGYVSTLRLRDNISATDHGTKYQCIASSVTYFQDEEYPSQVLMLNVHFPPDQPKPCKTSITGYSDYVMEGELLELRCISCSANPTANVEWFRNDLLVTFGISEREITDGDYNGYISTVSLTENITATDHGSNFRCVVSSKTYFPDKDYPSQVIKLNVHYMPRPASYGYLNSSTVNAGETAVLTCNVSSNPRANITWIDNADSVIINDTRNYHVHEIWLDTIIHSYLTIYNVNKDASGRYICQASNQVGKEEIEIHLDVIGKANFILPISASVSSALLLILLVLAIVCVRKKRRGHVTTKDKDDREGNDYAELSFRSANVNTPDSGQYMSLVHRNNRSEPIDGQMNLAMEHTSEQMGHGGTSSEVASESITFVQDISVGVFTKLVKGEMVLSERSKQVVTVKVLQDKSGSDEEKCFLSEIRFFKALAIHENIISMLGYITAKAPLCIVFEYCSHGNLKDFLLDLHREVRRVDEDELEESTTNQLLQFASQIATGMDFLEKIGCVHRALAAKSVHVGNGKVCKIAEFGFSSKVMDVNTYEKLTKGRIPIRWMALESILECVYTTKTDVWSYGIVLWEIFSFGNKPYPDMHIKDVILELRHGYRLPAPKHADEMMYSLMNECWQDDPLSRPTFEELVSFIDRDFL